MYSPQLTKTRLRAALVIALLADALQLVMVTPPFPEMIDLGAMVLTIWLLGFHWLLLPTFAVEFVPFVDMLPTWTGCVTAVIALRKREAAAPPPTVNAPPPLSPPPQLPRDNEDQGTRPR